MTYIKLEYDPYGNNSLQSTFHKTHLSNIDYLSRSLSKKDEIPSKGLPLLSDGLHGSTEHLLEPRAIINSNTDRIKGLNYFIESLAFHKELAIGILFLGTFILSTLLFALIVYFGFRRYKMLLRNKPMYSFDLEAKTEKSDLFTNKIYDETTNNGAKTLIQKKISLSKNLSDSIIMGTYLERDEAIENNLIKPSLSLQKRRFFRSSKPATKLTDICKTRDTVDINENSNDKTKDNPLNYELSTSILNNGECGIIIEKECKEIDPDSICNLVGNNRESPLLGEYGKESRGLSAFLNSNFDVSKLTECLNGNPLLKSNSKRVYSISEMIKLEPIYIYQMFEYNYYDVDLLVTDLIFPNIQLFENPTMIEIENTLTEIRLSLIDKQLHSSIKTIDLMKLISFSYGLKNYDNYKIFTLPYGILIESIIDFDLLSQIPNVSFFVKSAVIEIIIMYCINCWKSDQMKNEKFYNVFKIWNSKPYIPTKISVYKFIISLLVQGHRANILKGVLVFLSVPPTPHLLQNVISDALRIKPDSDIQNLLQYLKRQLQQEHIQCCANVENWRYWEFTTAGVQDNTLLENEHPPSVISKIQTEKYESLQNINSDPDTVFSARSLKRGLAGQNKIFKQVIGKCEDNNKEILPQLNLHSDSTRFHLGPSTILPGSLVASPIH